MKTKRADSPLSPSPLKAIPVALALAGLTPGVMASGLTTFVDGTPALADEVNGNFTYLDDLIAQLADPTVADMVSVNCGTDGANALQTAIDEAPTKGRHITVTGACNGVKIESKRNIIIDGQGTTTLSGGDPDQRPLDIGLGYGIFVKGFTADAGPSGADEAIVVGASTAVLEDFTAVNGLDTSVGIYTGSTAVFFGNNTIGDSDDSTALTINERSLVLAEGSLTLNVINDNINGIFGKALSIEERSVFDQDSGDEAGNVVTINGQLEGRFGAQVLLDNGTFSTTILVNSYLLAAPAAGQSVTANGVHYITNNSDFGITNLNGGTATFNSLTAVIERNSRTFIRAELNVSAAPLTGLDTAWDVSKGMTARYNSHITLDDTSLVNAEATFEIKDFSVLRTTQATIAEANVLCTTAAKVSAVDLSGGSEDDLCEADPAPPE